MVYRKLPDDLADKRPVLDAMGRCRQAILHAQDCVRPFGPTFKALLLVTTAIDAAALFLTGSETYYHVGGSAPGGEASRWRDTGS